MLRTRARHHDRRNDLGVFSVMYALMIVTLLSVAALGMDLGNAVSRKTDTQNQADFAAYDVGVEYAQNIASREALSVTSPIVTDVAASLNNNQPQDDDSPCWRNDPVDCVTPSQLLNGNEADGEVRYVADGLQVIAPQARVNFGFANVFGTSGTSVRSRATVNVFTAGPRILPMFAVSGCDWGRQTLTSPSTAEEIVPDLEFPAQEGPARPNEPTIYDASNNVVTTLTPGSSGPYVLVMDANQWQDTWKIGFFRETGSPRTIVVEGTAIRSAGDTTLPAGPPVVALNGSTAVNIEIPPAVYAEEGTWWIRAWGGENTIVDADNEWSPVNPSGPYEAPSIQVGTPVLECDAGPTDGNFGTIKLPREIPYNSNDLPANIATGLADGISLVTHSQADVSGLCQHGVNSAVESDTELRMRTNCVDTDTGLPANVATEGFISYNDGNGLLAGKETHDGCDPDGGSDERGVDVRGNDDVDYHINDDILSCFLLPGKTLAQVTADNYAGGAAFEADLLSSPRFAWVPVFEVRPDSGGSNQYSIVDFRPAFITDQDPTCSPPYYCATADNGLTIGESGVTHMKVVFFHIDALPRNGDVPLIDYIGVGEAKVHLID